MPEAQALQREDGLAEESMAEEPVVAWLKQVACGLPVSIPHFWPHTPFQAGMTPHFGVEVHSLLDFGIHIEVWISKGSVGIFLME